MPVDDVGLFSVQPEQISRLSVWFAPFVNLLLAAEAAVAGLAGTELITNYSDNRGDGGVDAALYRASETPWIPPGDSVWQFKAGDLKPGKCKTELRGASWARMRIAGGAKYRLVLGAGLGDNLISSRKAALVQEARDLGLPYAGDIFNVLDASMVARWASSYPALAVSRLLGGPGRAAVDHESWGRSIRHKSQWVDTTARAASVESLRVLLADGAVMDIRVDGVSGVGKTRLALEALRDQPTTALVAYVAEASALNNEFVNHLIGDGRAVILVVDECPARRHEKIAEQIPGGAQVKLITVGQPDAYAIRGPVISLSSMENGGVDELVKVNYPALWPEARRFIIDYCDGNPRFAILLAEKLKVTEATSAAALIEAKDIAHSVSVLLPEGSDFFGSALLALFDRIGWDRDRRYQMEAVAAFWQVSPTDLDRLAADLERRGLLERHGRYRSITPHPLAAYLAGVAWRQFGDRVADELLTNLDEEMSLALFKRVADLGHFESARRNLRRLLSSQGPFGSFSKIESGHEGRHLTQLAIAMPEEAAVLVSEVVEATSLDDLRAGIQSRRDLVWTLEKLVWHRRTFTLAANALLRLALAENETYGNSATGTWVGLFGTILPATAATTPERLSYLEEVAAIGESETATLVIRACGRALAAHHESVMVSGELQAGSLVEPRGQPATWDEVAEYRRGAIAILSLLATDPIPEVAEAASSTLIGALHPLLDDHWVGGELSQAVLSLSPQHQGRLREAVVDLLSMYERNNVREDRQRLVEAIRALYAALPPLSPIELLQEAIGKPRWDERGEALAGRIADQLRVIRDRDSILGSVYGWLASGEVGAAWELGYALAVTKLDEEHAVVKLLEAFEQNPAALAGYLSAQVAQGDKGAFDTFLDSSAGEALGPAARLLATVRGPATARASARIRELLAQLPVTQGARGLFGWHRNLSEDDILWILREWVTRIKSDLDYVSAVDWLGLAVYQRTSWSGPLLDAIWPLVALRRSYRAIGQERWQWARLGELFLPTRPVELADLVLDLLSSGLVMIDSDEEARILGAAAEAQPAVVWEHVSERMGSDWRIQLGVRGWFAAHVPVEVIKPWVGGSVARARVVAGIASLKGAADGKPSPVGRYLLAEFVDDDEIRALLYGDFVSGSWTGPESERIAGQVGHLQNWRTDRNEPAGLRRWAGEAIEHLEGRRLQALEWEAEQRW